MDMNELNLKLNAWLSKVQTEITLVVKFVMGRLQQFPAMSLIEKIAYPLTGVGLVLLLVSFVLFLF
jgi:hypothetical protein